MAGKLRQRRGLAYVALFCSLSCIPLDQQDDDAGSGGTAGTGSGPDPTPYLGTWHLTGTLSTTCSDGTNGTQSLAGTVSITPGTSSDLLRTVADGRCSAFPLNVNTANATLVASVACPADAASQITVTRWQVTLGSDDSSATETGSAKTVFSPPETGSCTSAYATTLVKE